MTKKRNPYARFLRCDHFSSRVVRSKKKYRRAEKAEEVRRNVREQAKETPDNG